LANVYVLSFVPETYRYLVVVVISTKESKYNVTTEVSVFAMTGCFYRLNEN